MPIITQNYGSQGENIKESKRYPGTLIPYSPLYFR